MDKIDYTASYTGSKFHHADDFVRAIMGPLGSGKTVTCIMELLRRAYEQAPSRKGVRLTRWALIRNTYRELTDTTIKTFFEWIPEELGVYSKIDAQFTLYSPLPDGTKMKAEFLFRALDRPQDAKKLLSLNLTGAFINEAREVPKAVFEALQGRCGRYPSTKDAKLTWHGVILDTNPPDSDHWWYKLFEELKPPQHVLFKQPGGMTALAENISNLPPRYYETLTYGKDQEWINVYVHGRYGFVIDGKPVWSEYKDDIHYTEASYVVSMSKPIVVGIDFGLTPAAVIGQVTPTGQFAVFDELVTMDMGAMSFGKLLQQKLRTTYAAIDEFEIWGDPAGEQRAQTDERTPYDILAEQGIQAFPTHTNDFTIRREVVADALSRLDFGGKPGLLVYGGAVLTPPVGSRVKPRQAEGAPTVRKALAGGYRYTRLKVSGQERYKDVPDKGKYSHTGDALQYAVLGALGSARVVGGYSESAVDYSVTDRMVV